MIGSLFAPPPVGNGALKPRPYQEEAIAALDLHLCENDNNPCVVIPTGGGKSLVIAWAILKWKRAYAPFRCIVLAHRRELVFQNSEELLGLWPGGDVGIYSAGDGRRDLDQSVIFASIDSVWERWGEFAPFDVVIVDEAHRIPAKGEGKYRTFIQGCRRQNRNLRVCGFTATPFRLGVGPICHRDHILNEICYEAQISPLIAQGYLCKLRTKIGADQPDLTDVGRNGRGDYKIKDLSGAVDRKDLVAATTRDMVAKWEAENRRCIVVFCVDVQHCKSVSHELQQYGITAPYVTAKTEKKKRRRTVEDFRAGRYRVLLNVNVYTEGFNVKQVDCVTLLRPTASPGLMAQMCGRGLRLHPAKQDCLILDYARLIETHGPLDCLEPGEVKLIECGSIHPEPTKHFAYHLGCGDVFSRAIRTCPHCGWTIPPMEVERHEAEERERKMHEREASERAILGSLPECVKVDSVTVHRHVKEGSPDSLRVQYRCGLSTFSEWICLDHPGFAGQKARKWWYMRFGREEALKVTVNSAMQNMLLGAMLTEMTREIIVVRNGKFFEITAHNFARD